MPRVDFSIATHETVASLLEEFFSNEDNLRYHQAGNGLPSLEAGGLITLDTLFFELARVQTYRWFDFVLDLIHSRPAGPEDRRIVEGMLEVLAQFPEDKHFELFRIYRLSNCLLAYSRHVQENERIASRLKNAFESDKDLLEEEEREEFLTLLREYDAIPISAWRQAAFERITAGVERSGMDLVPYLQSGFIAGTLVHTERGPIPIESIKVGDLVFSQTEAGRQKGLCKVLRLHRHEDQPVIHIQFNVKNRSDVKRGPAKSSRPHLPGPTHALTVSRYHPLWDEIFGWTGADRLVGAGGSTLKLIDGRVGEVQHWDGIFITDNRWIGWIGSGPSSDYAAGMLWDSQTGTILRDKVYYDEQKWDWAREGKEEGRDLEFLAPVYDLEVDSGHSYFVGEMGVTVCDASIDRGYRQERAIEKNAVRILIDEHFTKGPTFPQPPLYYEDTQEVLVGDKVILADGLTQGTIGEILFTKETVLGILLEGHCSGDKSIRVNDGVALAVKLVERR